MNDKLGFLLSVEKLAVFETDFGVSLVFLSKSGRSVTLHLEDAQADKLTWLLNLRDQCRAAKEPAK